MLYHVVLTDQCQLHCRYCGGVDTGARISYDMEKLRRFMSRDPDAGIGFYGGEPLMALDRLEETMDTVPAKYFHLQTNGLLLPLLKEKYARRMDTILVSVDGPKETTDYYRGKGTYDLAVAGARYARSHGFSGDLVARMTVSSHSDIYRDVTHLLFHDNPRFDHVHWQLDVFWSSEDTWDDIDFDQWSVDYMKGIERLARLWVERMRRGTVLGVAPFQGIMTTLITEIPTDLRCGAGRDAFAIRPDGTLLVCPISPDWDFAIVGDIFSKKPEDIRNIMELDEPCRSCDVRWVCGGRCMFANKTKLWGEDGFKKVCDITRHTIKTLDSYKEEVRELLDNGTITVKDLYYPVVNNGVEVIP